MMRLFRPRCFGAPVGLRSEGSASFSRGALPRQIAEIDHRVPALTSGVSTNFALANFLASNSFGNVSVAPACARFPGGRSNETYHVPLGDLPAMNPPASYAGAILTLCR